MHAHLLCTHTHTHTHTHTKPKQACIPGLFDHAVYRLSEAHKKSSVHIMGLLSASIPRLRHMAVTFCWHSSSDWNQSGTEIDSF